MSTVASFHAHPDDEALLTGGTMAKLSAEGHRVIIVMATDGALGLPGREASDTSKSIRLDELQDSASAVGAAKVVYLGYADSGHGLILYPDPPDRQRFVRADAEEAAAKLADVLREEGVDILLSYDEPGGYGHRDHARVHQVGRRAAELTGVRLLEATVPREHAIKIVRLMRMARLFTGYNADDARAAHSPRSAITYRIDVRSYARQKQAALAAHRSQMGIGRAGRAFWLLIRLPAPVFGLLMGREWYVEPGSSSKVMRDHII